MEGNNGISIQSTGSSIPSEMATTINIPTDSTSERAEMTGPHTTDRNDKHSTGRKKRQRTRPRSDWLLQNEQHSMNSTSTGDNFSYNEANGVIITRLEIRQNNHSYNNNHNKNPLDSNGNDSTTSSQVVTTIIPNYNTAPYLRIILPYPHTFTSYCKARWINRTVLDVYCNEFGSYPKSYYIIAIQQGRIRVSNQIVSIHYKLQAQDILYHTVHRHEPAVIVQSNTIPPYITIVEETSDLLAIDKPSTIPVHPCGGYYRNSVMNLLHESIPNTKFYTIHRLDRLTSGLIVLAKSSQIAKQWGQAIQQHTQCQKIYLARVKGKFGTNIQTKQQEQEKQQEQQTNILPRLYNTSTMQLPQYGEYMDIRTNTTCGNDNRTSCSIDATTLQQQQQQQVEVLLRRQKYGYGYWFTNAMTGHVYTEQEMSMEQYTQMEHTIEEWLQYVINNNNTDIDNNESKPTTDNDNTTISTQQPFVWLHIACPVRIEQPKIGICAAGTFDTITDELYIQTVKPAQTSIGIIQYCSKSNSTIVIVQPLTGRTHQIRIHLQHLHHSIANDPNYGGQLWFHNEHGQNACIEAQRILDMNHNNNNNTIVENNEELYCTNGLVTADTPATDAEVNLSVQGTDAMRNDTESLSDWIQRTCVWCNRLYGTNKISNEKHNDRNNNNSTDVVVRRAMLEFLVRSPGLWLHAFQYKVLDRSFRTKIPEWCQL
jgi:23S rRNA-/tRNA-specific pseudouridylate synthase